MEVVLYGSTERVAISERAPFVMIGERTNLEGYKRLGKPLRGEMSPCSEGGDSSGAGEGLGN